MGRFLVRGLRNDITTLRGGRMKKLIFTFLTVMMLMVLGFSMQAQAALELRGTDSLGNRLIYDTDFDITWYDYTRTGKWQDQMNWASALSVSGGNLVGVYDDWRLPTTVDGPYVRGYDGTTTVGSNITSSEMGHLYYTELGNKGYLSTTGAYQADYGLRNTGDFQHLQLGLYWSGTEYSDGPGHAWVFGTYVGNQDFNGEGSSLDAIAVRPGDVAAMPVVPEPISTTLFLVGAATLGLRRFIKK